MKNFSGRVALCAICFILSSCNGLDDLFGFREDFGGTQGKSSSDSSGVRKPIPDIRNVYVSGIDRQDSSLVLFKNGEQILSVPYGEEFRVSGDPDMHHLINGSLFTEYHDAQGTTIGRDSIILFSYDGEETLRGLLTDGDDVYTIGQRCSGCGFVFRKNGEPLLESDYGQVYGSMYDASYMRTGALYKDNGSVCFAYYSDKWHIVTDGVDNIINTPQSVKEIFDLRIVNGTVCYVSNDNYSSEPVLHLNKQTFDFSTSSYASGKDFRIYAREDGIFFCGSLKSDNKWITSCWSMDGNLQTFSGTGCNLYRDDDSCAFTQYSANIVQFYIEDKGSESLKGRYEYVSCWNADYTDGVLRAVLTPKDKNQKPFMWENGKKTYFDIKGSLTSVYYGI